MGGRGAGDAEEVGDGGEVIEVRAYEEGGRAKGRCGEAGAEVAPSRRGVRRRGLTWRRNLIGPWRHGYEGGAEPGGAEGLLAGLTTGSAHCTGKPRGSGWDSGRSDQIS